MGKTGTTSKKKYKTINIALDVEVIEALDAIAKMCDLTPNQIVNVYLATTIYTKGQFGLGEK